MYGITKLVHVVIDLETTATSRNACIGSLGAKVLFEDQLGLETDSTKHFHFNIKEQEVIGRDVDKATMEWWGRQPTFIRNQELGSTFPTLTQLENVVEWLKDITGEDTKRLRIWGNSNTFDNDNLRSLLDDYNIQVPWLYWQDRDFRTLKALIDVPAPVNPQPHSANYDALTEAAHMESILRTISYIGLTLPEFRGYEF